MSKMWKKFIGGVRMKYNKILLAFVLLILFSFTGCNGGTYTTLISKDSSSGSHLQCSYTSFNGDRYYEVSMKNSSKLELDYNAKVKKGNLKIVVANTNNNILWQKDFSQDGSGNVTIDTDSAKKIRITLVGQSTSGEYTVDYSKK